VIFDAFSSSINQYNFNRKRKKKNFRMNYKNTIKKIIRIGSNKNIMILVYMMEGGKVIKINTKK
jgi:hypothetical protein